MFRTPDSDAWAGSQLLPCQYCSAWQSDWRDQCLRSPSWMQELEMCRIFSLKSREHKPFSSTDVTGKCWLHHLHTITTLGLWCFLTLDHSKLELMHWHKEGGGLLLSSDNSWQTCFFLPVHIYSCFKGKHRHFFRKKKNNNSKWLKFWLNFLVFLKYTSVSEQQDMRRNPNPTCRRLGGLQKTSLLCFLPLVDLLEKMAYFSRYLKSPYFYLSISKGPFLPHVYLSSHLQKGKFKQIHQSSLDGQSHPVFSCNGQSQVLGHDGKSHHEWLLYFQNLLEEPQTDVLTEMWKTGYVWESLLGQMVAVLWIK